MTTGAVRRRVPASFWQDDEPEEAVLERTLIDGRSTLDGYRVFAWREPTAVAMPWAATSLRTSDGKAFLLARYLLAGYTDAQAAIRAGTCLRRARRVRLLLRRTRGRGGYPQRAKRAINRGTIERRLLAGMPPAEIARELGVAKREIRAVRRMLPRDLKCRCGLPLSHGNWCAPGEETRAAVKALLLGGYRRREIERAVPQAHRVIGDVYEALVTSGAMPRRTRGSVPQQRQSIHVLLGQQCARCGSAAHRGPCRERSARVDLCRALLLQGRTVREVIAATGLVTMRVQRIRRELVIEGLVRGRRPYRPRRTF